MEVRWLNVMVFCEDYEAQIQWYKNTFELKEILRESGAYHYVELGHSKDHVIVGLTPAKEVKHVPAKPRNNTTLLQLKVKDMKTLYEKVKTNGGEIVFDIQKDEKYNFLFGSIADLEGNEIWVVEDLQPESTQST